MSTEPIMSSMIVWWLVGARNGNVLELKKIEIIKKIRNNSGNDEY